MYARLSMSVGHLCPTGWNGRWCYCLIMIEYCMSQPWFCDASVTKFTPVKAIEAHWQWPLTLIHTAYFCDLKLSVCGPKKVTPVGVFVSAGHASYFCRRVAASCCFIDVSRVTAVFFRHFLPRHRPFASHFSSWNLFQRLYTLKVLAVKLYPPNQRSWRSNFQLPPSGLGGQTLLPT